MKKWKNKEHSSLPKSFLERTMFLKMQNSSGCGFLIISTWENRKKCQQNFTNNLYILDIFHENYLSKGGLKHRIWSRRTYQVYPVTSWAMITFVDRQLTHYWCKSRVKRFIFCWQISRHNALLLRKSRLIVLQNMPNKSPRRSLNISPLRKHAFS